MNNFVNVLLWVIYAISLYFSVFLLLVYFDNRILFKNEKSSLNPKKKPFVSIIVPAYNEEKTILRTLQSVSEIDYPKEKMEVFVVDDGSKDKTGEIIKKFIKDKPYFKLLSHKNK